MEYYEDHEQFDYADIILRTVGLIIDAVILGAIMMAIFFVFVVVGVVSFGLGSDGPAGDELTSGQLAFFLVALAAYFIVPTVVQWLYFAFMESSKHQGTLGKMALGIKVTDMNGKTIGFWHTSGRNFAKILSAMIFMIGYLFPLFTDKKQALHDMPASCLVLCKAREVRY